MNRPAKDYNAARGVTLDASFESHAKWCEQCGQFDAEKPATAGLMCLEGAVLYKRDNVEKARRAPAERSDTFASKAQMKSLMRYKGE